MAEQDNRRRDSRGDRAPREEKQFDERVVSIDRVARVVKGGRRFRFRALVVIGDGKGKVGVGTAKGADVTAAVSKATDVAKKNLLQVHVNEMGTIAHEQQARVAGANILLKPASPGTGLIAGGVVRVVLEVAGVKNALSKSIGSSNKINIAYATVEALKAIQPKEKWHTSSKTKSATAQADKNKTGTTTSRNEAKASATAESK